MKFSSIALAAVLSSASAFTTHTRWKTQDALHALGSGSTYMASLSRRPKSTGPASPVTKGIEPSSLDDQYERKKVPGESRYMESLYRPVTDDMNVDMPLEIEP